MAEKILASLAGELRHEAEMTIKDWETYIMVTFCNRRFPLGYNFRCSIDRANFMFTLLEYLETELEDCWEEESVEDWNNLMKVLGAPNLLEYSWDLWLDTDAKYFDDAIFDRIWYNIVNEKES